MSPFVFLGVAVAVFLLGGFVLWVRNRQPQSMEARMREFARELEALAPDDVAGRSGAAVPPRQHRGRRPG